MLYLMSQVPYSMLQVPNMVLQVPYMVLLVPCKMAWFSEALDLHQLNKVNQALKLLRHFVFIIMFIFYLAYLHDSFILRQLRSLVSNYEKGIFWL